MKSREWLMLTDKERQAILDCQLGTPVDLALLARLFGLKVVASTLQPGISGEIRPTENSYLISVNRHDSSRRQRFTVAHEIAHYLLHRDQIGTGIRDDVLYRSALSDTREAEANRLAAEMIMPRDKVDASWQENAHMPEDQRLQYLSERFAVSEIAMKIRLGLP